MHCNIWLINITGPFLTAAFAAAFWRLLGNGRKEHETAFFGHAVTARQRKSSTGNCR
jgi:hypothetical protein